jgi:hypothetical protein
VERSLTSENSRKRYVRHPFNDITELMQYLRIDFATRYFEPHQSADGLLSNRQLVVLLTELRPQDSALTPYVSAAN